jgi:hypothetical protein
VSPKSAKNAVDKKVGSDSSGASSAKIAFLPIHQPQTNKRKGENSKRIERKEREKKKAGRNYNKMDYN